MDYNSTTYEAHAFFPRKNMKNSGMGQFLPDSSSQNFRFYNTWDEFPQSTIDPAPMTSSSIGGGRLLAANQVNEGTLGL